MTARRSSRDLWAAAASLVVGIALAVYLVVGHHPWDSGERMPIAAGRGVHPTDLLAVIPLTVGFGLAAWFVWRSGRRGRADRAGASVEASPGVRAPDHR